MKYPSLDTFVEMNFSEDQVLNRYLKWHSCLKTIADTEQVYDCADSTQDELNEFLNL